MAKFPKFRIRFSFENQLIVFLVIIVITVLSTGLMAYKSLVSYTDAVKQSGDPEVRLIVIKSILSDLSSAEGNIKSYNLSKDEEYLNGYSNARRQLSGRMDMLNKMITGNVKQQMLLDSTRLLASVKLAYLDGFIDLQYRNLVTNELNSINEKIEKNKREVVILNTTREPAKKKGLMTRLFKKKSIQKEKAKADQQNLERQIRLLEEVKREVAKVRRKQGNKLSSIDQKELSLTQKNKEISEKIADNITNMEVNELWEARQNVIDLEKRHHKTNVLITFFSITASLFLLIIGFVVVSFLRKRRSYEKALVIAKNEAEHYSQMQETFLANMSHEIRTPMNAIAGFTEQVLQTPLQQQQKSYLQIVQRSIQHLLVIINDILDYSKLKADKLAVEHIPFDLQQVIGESVLLMSETATQKNIELLNDSAGKTLPQVMGDPVRMKQVLLNLIGNAIKFTDKGSVRVGLNIVEETLSHLIVELYIVDTGIGISKENISKIFDAFEQAEVSTTRKYGGSGLGLSITQKLVSLMKGSIALSSEEGQGTTVALQFSFETATDVQQMAEADASDLHTALAGKQVLIADDEEWNTALLATILAKYNIHYTIVKNGQEAVAYVTQNHVDLVLMDVRMPVLNGFEATLAIRQLPDPRGGVTVVALTAATGSQQLQKCYAAGMNAVLGKPYSEAQFFKVITAAMSHATIATMPEEEPSPKAIQEPQGTSFSLVQLELMSNGDRQFFNKMLRIFIDTTRDALDKIKRAIAEKDFETIEDYAHKLAPPCRHLDAIRLLQLLKQLEGKAREKKITDMNELHSLAVKEYKTIAAEMKKLLDS